MKQRGSPSHIKIFIVIFLFKVQYQDMLTPIASTSLHEHIKGKAIGEGEPLKATIGRLNKIDKVQLDR